jgi:hypothetical protein
MICSNRLLYLYQLETIKGLAESTAPVEHIKYNPFFLWSLFHNYQDKYIRAGDNSMEELEAFKHLQKIGKLVVCYLRSKISAAMAILILGRETVVPSFECRSLSVLNLQNQRTIFFYFFPHFHPSRTQVIVPRNSQQLVAPMFEMVGRPLCGPGKFS